MSQIRGMGMPAPWNDERQSSSTVMGGPVNCKPPIAWLAMVLIALGTSNLAAQQSAPEKISLPGYARSLNWDGGEEMLVASMTLTGTAFVPIVDGEAGPIEYYEDWPTMDSMSLSDGRYLMAGRFHELFLVERPGEGARFEKVASWETEGIPTNLAWDGEMLVIAYGGVGVRTYVWDGTESRPELRGRYPYVDYSKEIILSSDSDTLFVADNYDTGLQVLDISDPRRMRKLIQKRGNFVDSIDRHGRLLAVSRRHLGVEVYDMSSPEFPRVVSQIGITTRTDDSPPTVGHVRFDREGNLLVCENGRGARFFDFRETSDNMLVPELLWQLPRSSGSVGAATFLDKGMVALCSLDGSVTIVKSDRYSQQ